MEDDWFRGPNGLRSAVRLLRRRISEGRQVMVRYQNNTAVDFVIVGGGGAGSVVAKELSSAGFQVLILEQGPYIFLGGDHQTAFISRWRNLLSCRSLHRSSLRGRTVRRE